MKLSRSGREFGGDVGKSHPAPRVRVKNELLGSVAEQIDRSITKTSPEVDYFCTHPSG